MGKSIFLMMIMLLSVTTVFCQTDLVERQILVKFNQDIINFPEGISRASLAEVSMPEFSKNIFSSARTEEISKARPDFNRSDTLRVLADGRIFRVPDHTKLFIVTLPSDVNRDNLIEKLERLPQLEYAEKNEYSFVLEIIPNDTHFGKQWALKNTGQGGGALGADIKATFAWDITVGSSSIKIGVIDNGIYGDHPDLDGKVSGELSVEKDHGTHVTGIAAAYTDNNTGIAGVNWNAPVYFEHTDDVNHSAQAVENVVLAGCRVINNSWGHPSKSTTLYNAFRSAYEAEVLIVVANPEDNVPVPHSPQDFGPWITNIGPTDNEDQIPEYGRSHPNTDFAAPGGWTIQNEAAGIYSSVGESSYDFKFGTSMAAPHVTGIASLMLSVRSDLLHYEIEQILKRTAKNYPSWNDQIGYGRVDAFEAIKSLVDPLVLTRGNCSFSKIVSSQLWTFLADPVENVSAGRYYVDVWKLRANVSYPPYEETPMAWLPGQSLGYKYENPNEAEFWSSETISTTSMDLYTYFYYIRYHELGGEVNKWAPFDPNPHYQGSKKYTIIGDPPPPTSTASCTTPKSCHHQSRRGWPKSSFDLECQYGRYIL